MTTEVKSEIWKDIVGYEGIYMISDKGNVKSMPRKVPHYTLKEAMLLKACLGEEYFCVNLRRDGKSRTKNIHRLLAEHFIPNPDNKRTVNHKDGNKLNNELSNLEWATDSENNQHAYNTGLHKPKKHGFPVVAIQDTSILEFDNVKDCATYFGVITRTVRQAISHPCRCKGHNIFRL